MNTNMCSIYNLFEQIQVHLFKVVIHILVCYTLNEKQHSIDGFGKFPTNNWCAGRNCTTRLL